MHLVANADENVVFHVYQAYVSEVALIATLISGLARLNYLYLLHTSAGRAISIGTLAGVSTGSECLVSSS